MPALDISRLPVRKFFLLIISALSLSACGVSEETQALIDEYNRTIPTCEGEVDCAVKWATAREWVLNTPSYRIRTDNEERIDTFRGDMQRAGTALQVVREPLGGDRYRILVEIDCYATRGCLPEWETKIEFNRIIGNSDN